MGKLIRMIWAGVLLAALYAGGVIWWRGHQQREAERAQQEKAAEQARRTVEMNGGNRLKIIHFYAAPPEIRRGGSSQLCYGVANAASVSVEPPAGEVWPSMSRCVEISPKRRTEYRLKARDKVGNEQMANVTVNVK